MRPMSPKDWIPASIEPGRYCNATALTGFQRRDGLGGNVLHPAPKKMDLEFALRQTHAAVCTRFPGVRIKRYHVRMPYWRGEHVPSIEDYRLVDAPQSLTTTSITVVMVSQTRVRKASMGFYFCDDVLPPLRARLQGRPFRGIAGNLGYYMTAGLIDHKFPWSHNRRYPQHPIPKTLSYLGFHMTRDPATDKVSGSFQGVHPAAVGIRLDGNIRILPRLDVAGYEVTLGHHTFAIDEIDDPWATQSQVALFTPACRTIEIQKHIAQAITSHGQSSEWQTYAPMIPLPDAADRVHVFVANKGNGLRPVQEAIAAWDGPAPLPSFGAVLSFQRPCFQTLFGSVRAFREQVPGQPVQIAPFGVETAFNEYAHVLGGLVPAVINGEHVYDVDTVTQVMRRLDQYGNAISPMAESGRESRNFDPYIREPAGVLVQTANRIGWALFDGRHELSVGTSIVDVAQAQMLRKLETEGAFGQDIAQAVFVDGGSAMKAYAVESDGETVKLDLLNRVAAGSRNEPGNDPDGFNLYTTLDLQL